MLFMAKLYAAVRFKKAVVVLKGTLLVMPLPTVRACVICDTDKHGFWESSMAAAPDTCGVAMLVPDSIWYPPPGHVLVTYNPGAEMSTQGP
jgi:hypothetical protein